MHQQYTNFEVKPPWGKKIAPKIAKFEVNPPWGKKISPKITSPTLGRKSHILVAPPLPPLPEGGDSTLYDQSLRGQ